MSSLCVIDKSYEISNNISIFSEQRNFLVNKAEVPLRGRKGIRTNSIICQVESGKVPNRANFSWKNASFYRVKKDVRKARQKMLSDIAASKIKTIKVKNLNDLSGQTTGIGGLALIGLDNGSGVPTLTPSQVTEIYTAKCKDLRVSKVPNQELRFQEYCRKFCIDGKIILKEVFCLVLVVRDRIDRSKSIGQFNERNKDSVVIRFIEESYWR